MYVYLYVYVCMYIYIYIYIFIHIIYTHTYSSIVICMYIYIYIHRCTYLSLYVYMYIYIYNDKVGTLTERKFLNSSFSSSDFSIRAFRAYPLVEIRQAIPERPVGHAGPALHLFLDIVA